MSSVVTYEDVLRTAQTLNDAERLRLVQELLNSLNPGEAAVLDDAWLVEIDRRSHDLDAGTVQAIPWAEVRRRAKPGSIIDTGLVR